MTESELQFDAVVVGGGMVGAALACALAEADFSVAVIETRAPLERWPAQEIDLRVSALTRASQRILRNLGVWERMCQLGVTPYRVMFVWDAGGTGRIHFDAADVGEPDLGHIVENRVIQLALWERLRASPGARLYCPASVVDFELDWRQQKVALEGGEQLSSRILVAADGGDSNIRNRAGIQVQGWGYDQQALVATVRPEKFHRETARQRFMATGPLAFLPVRDGQCSIVWSTSVAQSQALLSMDEAAFRQRLSAASEYTLGPIREVGPRAVFPLRLQHARQYVKEGLALVGDAIHRVHPLAGQGVNLGFLDAATLAQTLVQAHSGGRPLGSLATLRRYERARKGHNLMMLAAMDGFKRLFSNDLPPLRLARNLGLTLADKAAPAKALMIRRAMGIAGELPELARHLD